VNRDKTKVIHSGSPESTGQISFLNVKSILVTSIDTTTILDCVLFN